MKKKEIFHFLNKEITTQTAQNFFFIIFGKLQNVNLSVISNHVYLQ